MEQEQTAIQELIEHLKDSIAEEKNVLDNPTNYRYIDVEHARSIYNTTNAAIKMCEAFLEKEKQQIIDSFNEGYREAELDSESPAFNGDISEFSNAEDYYNNKYQSK